MSTERERVYLDLHKSFVKENIPGTDGKTFNSVSIPGDVMIDGQNVGGYKFFPLFVNDSLRSESWRTIPLLADREIQLGRTHLDKDGNPLLDENGQRVIDIVNVMPRDLVDAVEAARAEYRDTHPREIVWVNVHKSFVAQRERFVSVGLAPNTMIGGKDFGGYRFAAPSAHPSQYNDNVLGVPLDAARNYKISGGENFADTAYVKGIVLKEAIETARDNYRAERAAQGGYEEKEADEDLLDLESDIGSAIAASVAAYDSYEYDNQQEVPLQPDR